MKTDCLYCLKEFDALPKDLNRGRAIYCSLKCSASHSNKKRARPKLPNCKCAFCQSTFYRTSSKQSNSKSGLQFCNRRCKEQAQMTGGIKEIQPSHYGTGDNPDYRTLAMRHLPNECNRCTYSKCLSCLEVHHRDRNRENNDLSNLEILCRNCHGEEHHLKSDLL